MEVELPIKTHPQVYKLPKDVVKLLNKISDILYREDFERACDTDKFQNNIVSVQKTKKNKGIKVKYSQDDITFTFDFLPHQNSFYIYRKGDYSINDKQLYQGLFKIYRQIKEVV